MTIAAIQNLVNEVQAINESIKTLLLLNDSDEVANTTTFCQAYLGDVLTAVDNSELTDATLETELTYIWNRLTACK